MRRAIGVLGITTVLVAAGCTDGGGGFPGGGRDAGSSGSGGVQAASVGLERFGSCDELLTYVKTEAADLVGPYGMHSLDMIVQPSARTAVAEFSADADGAPTAGAASPATVPGVDYSDTNVQEAGVDEPDIVKTDGRRIFVVTAGELHQLLVTDAGARLSSSVELPGSWGHELLVHDDRVLVLSPPDHGGLRTDSDVASDDPASPHRERTLVSVVDVSDPAAMHMVSKLHLDGSYVSARLVGGIARVVVRSHGAHLAYAVPEPRRISEAAAERHNRRLVEQSTVEDWLPGFTLEDGRATVDGRLAGCDQTYRPAEFSGLGTTTVVTIDPADPTPRESAAVVADAEIVYSSQTGLYVATNRWQGGPRPMPMPEPMPEPDIAPAPQAVTTDIHMFDISEDRQATYVASGSVHGRLLNQWALSEHAGHLRVATTDDRFDRPELSESFVTVLAARDGELVQVGQVGDLGRDERIYSVRFMGDIGYVVTFREIDPLYTIDLSDPAEPSVLGELKIPGYSSYLHPIGEGLLLGIGQDATDRGVPLGTQVSIFDVRNPAEPTRLQHFRLADGSSEAEYDHRAFLYWAPEKLAIVPMQTWARDRQFAGAVALSVDPADGIRDLGRVGHPQQARSMDGDIEPHVPGDRVEPSVIEERLYEVSPPIRRCIVIGDTLFTISEAGLLASDLRTLEQRAWVALR